MNQIKCYLEKLIIAFVLWLVIIQPSLALSVNDVPQPFDVKQNYIVDLANVLDRDTEATINNEIAVLQRNKNKTIYIITVPSISYTATKRKFKIVPAVSESRRFLESILLNWNVEQLKQGNGILVLISTGDRSIEIRSSVNLKYIIQDRHIQGIIDKIMIPKFRQNDFEQGILLGTKTIIRKINNPYYNLISTPVNIPWQSKLRLEFELRNIPNLKGDDLERASYPNEISYYGGSGTW